MKAHMTQILRKKDIKVKDDECSVILRLAIKCEGDDQRQAELRKNTQNMFVKRRLMSPRLLELKITSVVPEKAAVTAEHRCAQRWSSEMR